MASALRRMSSFSARDLAGDADGEARARERVAPDEMLGQAQLAAERAHLVLEQLAQRLDQLQVHALGQAADVVVRLDGHRRAADERHALDHVGIERALRQELGAAELLGLLVEHLDEQRRRWSCAWPRGRSCRRARPGSARLASTCTSGMLKWPRNSDTTSLASFRRSRPWSTKMQVSWSPIASWISTAATALSTPPDRPQMTRPLPTWARILAISAGAEVRHGPVARQAGDAAHEVADQLAAAWACAPPRGGTARRRACASRRRWRRTARPSRRRPP